MRRLFATAALASAFAVTSGLTAQAQGRGITAPLTDLSLVQPASAEATMAVAVTPASLVMEVAGSLIMVDPVGAQAQYRSYGSPDIVVLTRVSEEHLSIDTMIGLLRRDTVVLAPQAVIDQLPLMISNNTFAPFDIGQTQEVAGITFRAMDVDASLPGGTQMYQRDRGDIGVIMETGDARIFF
ncbi:MAG: hypothetical protein AAFM92_16530 [Pseudomonadota bacterium]